MTSYFHPTTNTFHPATNVWGLEALLRGTADTITAEPSTHRDVGSPTFSPSGPPKWRSAGIVAAVVAGAVAIGLVVATDDSDPDVVDPPVELSVAEPGQSSQEQVQQSIDQALADARAAQNTPRVTGSPALVEQAIADALADARTEQNTPRLLDSSIVAIEARNAEAADRARAAQNTPRVTGSPALVEQAIADALADARTEQNFVDVRGPGPGAGF